MTKLFKAPTSNFWSTTLNGAINSAVDEITLNSVVGLQAPGYLIIDRQDGNNNDTSEKREVVYFTGINGNSLTGVDRGADGSTARSHSDGSLVEAVPTVGMWNDQRDWAVVEHNVDGTHKSAAVTTLKATDAEIDTGTEDAKIVTPKAIADSSIQTGWTPARETWTFSSVDNPTGVITVPSDARTKYSVGMRIKLTNGGNTIYGIITAVAETALTFLHEINPGTNQALHLLANSAITNPYYSTQKVPFGFPLSPNK